MPSSCGPGKYAVGLPHHLVKRGMTVVDPIYVLTFDYQFKRVPRDLGNTQMRIDFSNEPEYWNNTLNKTASSKRRKRSLEEVGGNHKRWLEEEWRDDAHFGGFPKKNSTSLEVNAERYVNVDVNYSFTLITILSNPSTLINLSDSFLYFRTKGDVNTKFVINAAVTAMFNTSDIIMFFTNKFRAAFVVPSIITISLNFKLFGRLEANGYITFYVDLKVNSESSFCYGVDAGVDLYVTIDAPSEFSWALPNSPFPIVPIDDVQLYPTGGEPACIDLSKKRGSEHDSSNMQTAHASRRRSSITQGKSRNTTSELAKRAKVYGAIDVGDIPPCPLCGDDDRESLEKRADSCWLDPYGKGASCPIDTPDKGDIQFGEIFGNETESHHLEKRDTKYVGWGRQFLPCGTYKSCGAASKQSGVNKWFGFRSNTGPYPVTVKKLTSAQTDASQYVTEHIYEVQMLPIFVEWFINGPLPGSYTSPLRAWMDNVLIGMNPAVGGDHNPGGLALADKGMNGRKEHLFAGNTISSDIENNNLNTRKMHRNTAAVFSYMRNSWIWPKFVDSSQYMEQTLREFDTSFNWNDNGAGNNGQLEAKFRASSFGSDEAGIKWLQNVMTPRGPISARNLVFLHSNQVPHRFNPGSPNPVRWLLSNFEDLWMTRPGYGAAEPF
ncbi:hypothetical protein COCVIDRAFT_11746 [Bipolaris victoriae FI3]|uniref:Uncharacterized protein n=1 Tax=Bipolaris victoriae (strain FI3) TaxID=930091 RepID=W7F1X5_BIPV3|nr:hypothetical protein COCVIDRAFT_11746 [Bipolaris victoriae FI3]